jgi:hypothetical protein
MAVARAASLNSPAKKTLLLGNGEENTVRALMLHDRL